MSSQHAAGPAERVIAATLSDTVNEALGPCRSIYCEGAGDLKFVDMFDNVVSAYTVAALSYHPIRAKRIYSTGTTVAVVWLLY